MRPASAAASRRGAGCIHEPGRFDYVLLSDVHLGSDIVTHLRPWAATSWLTREAEVDAQLVSLFEHHRRTRAPGRPLCVVIAGDFLDLVGISLTPPAGPLRTSPTREERRHGLGSAPDHVVHKVHAIAERHPRVFRALSELLADGNELVLVRGNHDIELHWHAAQQAFIRAITAHAPAESRAEVAARIAIHPWFFVVRGVLYVEHGHHFDAMCSYGDPLLPTCPRDSRRIRPVPFSVLLRNVARPTRGLSTASYEHVSFGAYLGLLVKLGFGGSVRIALRFARATACLLEQWRVHARAHGRRRAHRRQLRRARFAAQSDLPFQRLRELEALYAQPAANSLTFVLRSIYLDRVLALSCAAALVVAGALLARYRDAVEGVACALPAALFAAYACIGVERDIVPTRRMQQSAARIATLFDVRWVAMGHTHRPLVHELERGARYVNLGNWGEDDLPEERAAHARSPCSFLHLRFDGAQYRGELMRWDAHDGASQLAMSAPTRATRQDERIAPGAPDAYSV